jgi:hypothetical protein
MAVGGGGLYDPLIVKWQGAFLSVCFILRESVAGKVVALGGLV